MRLDDKGIGQVAGLPDVPDLERFGWRHRSPLAGVVHEESYGAPYPLGGPAPTR